MVHANVARPLLSCRRHPMTARRFTCYVLTTSVLLSASQIASGSPPASPGVVAKPRLHGEASYYADAFQGRKTSSGEKFDMHDLTAAHRKLAFGTHVRVTNLDNGREVIVRINDRGPYYGERVIDLSYGAARELGMIKAGVAPVDIEILRQ